MKMFEISALLVLLAVLSIECNIASYCSKNQLRKSYLDIAVDMITKAKHNTHLCKDGNDGLIQRAVDCADIFHMGFKKSGIYKVRPMNRLTEEKVLDFYCDMETDGGGWTVIQRRGDFQRPHDNFFNEWKNYKEGFGDLEKDFWLGDSMIAEHNNQKFSTKDQDNDDWEGKNCAADDKGGWWYKRCHRANLNGLYLRGKLNKTYDFQGISWNTWKGHSESLVWTEMKIRPRSFSCPLNFMNKPKE